MAMSKKIDKCSVPHPSRSGCEGLTTCPVPPTFSYSGFRRRQSLPACIKVPTKGRTCRQHLSHLLDWAKGGTSITFRLDDTDF